MTITFACDCGQRLQANEEQAGQRIRCPKCNSESVVPTASADHAVRAAPPRPSRRDEDEEEEEATGRSRRRAWGDDEDDEDDGPRGRAPRTSGKAITAFVLGLLSFCLWIFAGIPAIVYGILGLRDIGASRGRLKGQGLAIAGMILGGVAMLLAVPFLLIALLVPAVQKVREAAGRTADTNNLKAMALAMHNYHDATGTFPTDAAIRDKNGKPLLSWRVAILPYLGQDGLFRQFKLDEPWDSPHNKSLLPLMPKEYAFPGEAQELAQGLTHYRVFVGPQTAFAPGQRSSIPAITDGTSNTIMIVETADAVPWTKPDEVVYDPKAPLPKFGHPGGWFNVALFDGSVRRVPVGIDEATLRALITANGGDVVRPNW